MATLPKEKQSYWLESTISPGYPKLSTDISTDVVIIGAGVAGLTTAYLLKKAGLKVAVLEKDTIAEGVSGHTTGKITSQHNIIYSTLTKRLGTDLARAYGEANELALAEIARIIEAEQIDCDFRREDNYVFTTDKSKVTTLQNEATTAAELGLPASFETTTELPFQVEGAVKFSNQATFHIRKYLLALAELVQGEGSYVYEHSRVTGIRDGTPGRVKTADAKVAAMHIVVATNVPTFPLLARGTYCIAEYPMQSYIVAAEITNDIPGMYVSPDKEHYSIYPAKVGSKKYLFIGGEGHVPGARFNPHARYQRLADYAEKHFEVKHIDYRWTHRDYLGYDDMPLIGKLYPWSKNTYTATGFMKWGMTNGTFAGMLLRDMILDIDNKWRDIYSPHRFKAPASIPKVIGEKLGLK